MLAEEVKIEALLWSSGGPVEKKSKRSDPIWQADSIKEENHAIGEIRCIEVGLHTNRE